MKLTPNFNRGKINKALAEQREKVRQAIISRLQFVGETFITEARDNGTYKDRTANLRNSAGYVILEDGEQLFISTPGKTKKGQQRARKTIDNAQKQYESYRGFVLICVAGMEYAAAVESRGYDVITGSTMLIEEDLKEAIKGLQKKIAQQDLGNTLKKIR
jgi:hypothetical protein